MNRLILVAALLALLPVSGGAMAAPSAGVAAASMGDLDSLRAEVKKAEAAVTPLYERRATLSAAASSLATQISELKSKPASVRHDLELQRLLADSKTKTDELERVQAELRWREPGLAELRRKLVRQIDGLLETQKLSDATRLDLEHLRTAQVALLVSPSSPVQIARERSAVAVDPLDGPRELRYKADLLRDSGDKLRREASRIATRLDSVERRRHLRERAGSLDDDMFGEATSSRRVARTQGALNNAHGNSETTNKAAAPNDPAQSSDSATPPPATPSAGGMGAAPGVTGGTTGTPSNTPVTTPNGSGFANNGGGSRATSSESTVLRNIIDPKTLDELRRADEIDDVDRQTRALKRAQAELETMAKELDRRAKALEGRATELRNQK